MEPINLHDYEELARQTLPGPAFDFIAGGAEDEVTLNANRTAWQRIQLLPRVLMDVSHVDTSTSVLGRRIGLPVLLAPVALQRLAHPDGELAVARAAAAAGTVQVLSTMSSYTMEDVAAAGPGPRWFQLYCYRDKDLTRRLVQRAEALGFEALCLTVDLPRLGRRERDLRNRMEFPPDVVPMILLTEMDPDRAPPESGGAPRAEPPASLRNLSWEVIPSLTWADVDWLRSLTSMPLVLKGILASEDARIALDHGVAAIIVSNHGGRQLDGVPAAIEVLPEVVEAVQGRAEVLVDGGVRRGVDIMKALALGARAVLIGRAYLWGLAAGGEEGVARVLDMLRAEFEMAMALAGCRSASEITRALVRG